MKIDDFYLTQHAIERALDMAVDGEEIRQCLIRPEATNASYRYPGCTNYRLGRIVCAVDPDWRVVTVIWATPEDWQQDIEGIGPYAGREYRGALSA